MSNYEVKKQKEKRQNSGHRMKNKSRNTHEIVRNTKLSLALTEAYGWLGL
jgi:hypothetical protein